MIVSIRKIALLLSVAAIADHAQPKEILIRCDDIGMCHTVNMAFEKVAQTGIPLSASVMFACPWHNEAVEILKRFPHVVVGVHLVVNAEWKGYRWGPVAGWNAVPSLTDSLGFFFPSACAWSTAILPRSFPFTLGRWGRLPGSITLAPFAGSVVVTGWPRSEVEVTGTLGKGAERLEFSSVDKLTRVKVVYPKRSSGVESSNLVIKVPAGTSLSVNTVSADVYATGVRGSQRLQSVSGDIRTEAGAEDVECKTVSGDVTVTGTGQRGLLTVTTVSGDATLTRVAGDVNGNTVSGDFTIAMGDASRSRLRSTSGDLGLKARLTPEARLDFESISGDVRLDLEGPVGAEFDVSSFNGDIRNCFGPPPVRTSEHAPGRELRFREGQGTARVRIKTLNGDVSVCNK